MYKAVVVTFYIDHNFPRTVSKESEGKKQDVVKEIRQYIIDGMNIDGFENIQVTVFKK